ncbi:AAA family ATPase [Alteromonas sp. KS69]|jgi:MoxR-like ATPase|uniref:AAA family ATPase n=1 Tax=unclassified Alteromonas TaxID=2614992 RepID=UPI000C12212A|nr:MULTISPECIES: MoxR family ATPase [unclassified Alteromonas]MBO7924391.1 MoxR family ATPase [Alteromonas sp. K632G]PHS55329.1 MAG: AAA family ATPase [Alteromonas sp.]RUP75336.1 AAA family ATPase [Alteromonas sp. KS69]|tara:strand:- start:1464 stop:2375 length:912 start_codon:yes stop_codon:yes gene_type:complete
MRKEIQLVHDALSQKIIGKSEQLKLAVTCLLAHGHLLIEDLPGMGKTTLSHALSHVFGLQYSRIQFTSDLLPSDMLGVNVYQSHNGEFQFRHGPIFSQVVLADELNRASPKTQSALLEAMEERQVSIDGTTHALPSPFFVIGTQNPGYQSGTYPLPESQLDRFFMRISLGFPNWEAEKAMLKQSTDVQQQIASCLSQTDLITMQDAVTHVHASDDVINYILRLVTESRAEGRYPTPLSPRASRALLQAARAWAYMHDRTFVTPDDVQAIFVAVTEHRLSASTPEHTGTSLSQHLLDSIDPLAA